MHTHVHTLNLEPNTKYLCCWFSFVHDFSLLADAECCYTYFLMTHFLRFSDLHGSIVEDKKQILFSFHQCFDGDGFFFVLPNENMRRDRERGCSAPFTKPFFQFPFRRFLESCKKFASKVINRRINSLLFDGVASGIIYESLRHVVSLGDYEAWMNSIQILHHRRGIEFPLTRIMCDAIS